MKFIRWVLAFTVGAFLFVADGEAGTIVRDFSGDAMQRHDSRMMSSPLQRIPDTGIVVLAVHTLPSGPSLTVVNIQINLPALVSPFSNSTTRFASPSEILDKPMWDLCGDRSESGDEPNGRRTKPLLPLTAAGQYLREPHLFSE